MTHLDDEKLNAWIDKNLAENERQEAERHIEGCYFCRGKADELIALCNGLNNLPKRSVSKPIEKEILKSFRAEKKEGVRLTFSIPGYSAIMAGTIAGLLLGYLINPFIRTVSDTGQILYSENGVHNTIEDDDYYLQHLLADNGGDLW